MLTDTDERREVFARVAALRHHLTADWRMVVLSDGDHCIYNHRSDRDALMADWLRARLLVGAVGLPDPKIAG